MSLDVSQEEWNYWYDKVFGYFLRRIGDYFESQELTSETLSAYFLHPNKSAGNYGLVWAIARNKLLEHWRRSAKSNLLELDWEKMADKTESPTEYSSLHSQRLERLQKCMQKILQETEVKIVEMCIMYDFSSQKVAQETGLTSVNVRQKLSRCLKKVRKQCAQAWQENNSFN